MSAPADTPSAALGAARVVMVSGAKGGVGKSTVTALVARQLARRGSRVGLLDADVTTPSQALLFGVSEPPEVRDGRMRPAFVDGVAVFSSGSFGADDTPFVWHGLALRGFVLQAVRDVDWGRLDVLLVDMPAGTGEAHVAVLDLLDVDRALLVTAAQSAARADLRRLLGMLRRLRVPLAGVVDNSVAPRHCPHCGHATVPAEPGASDDVLVQLPWTPAAVTPGADGHATGELAAALDRIADAVLERED